MIDFFNLAAQRLHGKPEGWKWCQLDAHRKPEDFVEVTGAVPVGVVSRGPRKGSPKWPKELERIWLRMSDIERVRLDWERETGKCNNCCGRGRVSAGWSRENGRQTRECSRCGGSGKAVVQKPESTEVNPVGDVPEPAFAI